MIRNFFYRSVITVRNLFVVIIMLCVSCEILAAWSGTLYFDNSATQWANVGVLIGRSGYRRIQPCTRISNTDVWSFSVSNTWGDETAIYWVNYSGSEVSTSSDVVSYSNGFQDRNITVNQISTTGGGSGLAGKIFVPESAIGREAGTTWKTYTASDYTSITGNGRLIQTNGFAIDDNNYAYINVRGVNVAGNDLSNADYGENAGILKGWYSNTGSGGGSILVESNYVGYNSGDQKYLYRFVLGEYFTSLIPLNNNATGDPASYGNTYYDESRYLLNRNGNSNCYYEINGTLDGDKNMSAFTSLGSPTISSSPSSGSLGTTFTITLTAASNSTLSGGNTYRIYATDGENLYEICQPQTGATSVTWTPTTAASWTLYSIVTDKYGAERKKSEEITVSNCGTPAAKTISADVTTICSGNDITITVPTSESGYIYTVYTEGGSVLGKGDGTGSDLGIVINPKNSYTISVKAAKAESCPGTAMNNTIAVIVNQTPVLSESSTTQYKPVTVTGTSSSTWDVVAPSNTKSYFTDASGKTTVFKGSCVNSGGTLSDAEYTIKDTSTSPNCSATLTVSKNAEVCEE